VSLSIQKSVEKNCVATDSEVGSQNLCCYRFRNRQHKKLCRYRFRSRQPKTVPLSIKKSAPKNYVAADSKIGSKNYVAIDSEIDTDKLCRCRLRNGQRWWGQFLALPSLFYFLFGFTGKRGNNEGTLHDP